MEQIESFHRSILQRSVGSNEGGPGKHQQQMYSDPDLFLQQQNPASGASSNNQLLLPLSVGNSRKESLINETEMQQNDSMMAFENNNRSNAGFLGNDMRQNYFENQFESTVMTSNTVRS